MLDLLFCIPILIFLGLFFIGLFFVIKFAVKKALEEYNSKSNWFNK